MLDLAKKAQFVDRAVPPRWRVPFRYLSQSALGGLEPEMRLLPTLVRGDKLAVDVGGNRGTYAFALSKLAREVHTFEPVPDCATLLRAWAKGRNVVVHECGLGETEGTLTLHVPRVKGSLMTTRASFARDGGFGVNLAVPVRALDSFELDDVGFVKIDVEGFELSTLRGAAGTIRRDRPNLLVEIDSERQTPEEFDATFEWLSDLGYDAYYLRKGIVERCGADVRGKVSVQNFVFLPNDRT